MIIYLICYVFFSKSRKQLIKKNPVAKILFFLFLVKIGSVGPVDQQINLVLPYFESVGLENYNDFKPFIEYSYDTNYLYKNLDKYSANKKCETLIVFDMIADMLCYRILNPNQQKYLLEVEKTVLDKKSIRLNFTHYFIMKIPNKQEFQEFSIKNSSDINFKDLMNLYKNALPTHILLYSKILLLHKIIPCVLNVIF